MPSREDIPLKDRARGRWHGILQALGVDRQFLNDKHGPCPVCGGKDRFRFDDRDHRGTFFCSFCGAGDGVTLVMRVKGLDFKTAAQKNRGGSRHGSDGRG